MARPSLSASRDLDDNRPVQGSSRAEILPKSRRVYPLAAAFDQLTCAVLIPCFNEEAAIAEVVTDFKSHLPFAQVYVFDNNSTDQTARLAAAAGAIVRREPRQGKGHVIRRMFAEINADFYVLVDGDGTYAAEDALAMLSVAVAGRCDLVNGRRPHDGQDTYRPGHAFGNRILTGLVARTFGCGFDDMLSGSKVFSRAFAKSFGGCAQGFEIETELTVHALSLDMAIAEQPIGYAPRKAGSPSKLNTIRDGIRILNAILRLVRHERPLLFFGLIASAMALCSAALGTPVIAMYLETGLVPRLPMAILAMGVGLLAFGSLFTGLILDTVTAGRRETRRLHYLLAGGCRRHGGTGGCSMAEILTDAERET